MTAENFCYWLMGFIELREDSTSQAMNSKQVEIIKRHLSLVFAHDIDPKAGGEEVQAKLNVLHKKELDGSTARC